MELCDQYLHDYIKLSPTVNDFFKFKEYEHLRHIQPNYFSEDYDEKLKDQEEKHRKELEEEKADRAIRFFDEEDGSTDLSDDETLDSFDFEEDDDNDDEDNDKDKDKKKGAESEEKNEQQLVVVSSILKKDSTVASIPRGGVDGEQKLTRTDLLYSCLSYLNV